MEFWLLVLVIAAPILAVLGWLFWIAVIAFIVKAGFDTAGHANPGIGFGGGVGNGELDALMTQLQEMLGAASGGGTGAAGLKNLTPAQQLQIQTMMMKAHNQMAQINDISRQRYETRMGELSGMAASAGLDWTPGSY